jgi:hypothetical protein
MNNYYKGIGKSLPGYSRNLAVEAFTTFVTTGVNEFFSAAMIAAGVEKELGAVVSKDYKDKQGVATDLVVSLGEIACESSGNSKQVGFLEKLGAGFPSLLDKNGEREKVFFKVCDAGLSCFENKEKLQLFLGKSDSKVAVDALHDFVKNGRKFHKPVAGVLTSLTYKKWLSKYKKSKSPWVVALAKTSDCAIKAVLSTMIGDGFKKYIAK